MRFSMRGLLVVAVDNRFQIEISPFVKSKEYPSLHGQILLMRASLHPWGGCTPSISSSIYHRRL